jgi:hypothetical protein
MRCQDLSPRDLTATTASIRATASELAAASSLYPAFERPAFPDGPDDDKEPAR